MLKSLTLWIGLVGLASGCGASGSRAIGSGSTGSGSTAQTPLGPAGCGLTNAAFCDTFDTPSPGGNAGDLDDSKWSAARASGLDSIGQGQLDWWPPSLATACGMTLNNVLPHNDMFFCAGGPTPSMHFNNAYNDGQSFTVHSYRIRQPFDFTNRTGVVVFDVDGQSQFPGGHGYWFNFFIASEPIPIPYQDTNIGNFFAKEGVGIEFQGADVACVNPTCKTFAGIPTSCGNANAVSNFFIEDAYQIVQTIPYPGSVAQACFKTQPEVLNHFEVHISQSKIEVLAADAGQPSTLRTVAVADGLSLPLTRGYVSLQHTHYNEAKSGLTGLPMYHTYHWDNVGFDGPVAATPRSYEVPDSLTSNRSGVDIGYALLKTGMATPVNTPLAAPISLQNVDTTNSTDAVLTFNTANFQPNDTISYQFNNAPARTYTYSFPTYDHADDGTYPVAIAVQLSDLQQGTNTFQMSSASGQVGVYNVELTIDTQ